MHFTTKSEIEAHRPALLSHDYVKHADLLSLTRNLLKNTQQRPGLFVYKIRVEELEDSRQRHSSNFQALCDCVFYEVLG